MKNLIHYLPQDMILLLFDRAIVFCENGSVEVLCLKQVGESDISSFFGLLSETVKSLKLNDSYKTRIEKDCRLYLEKWKSTQDTFETSGSETVILPIKEMYEKFPTKHFDWLQMINNQLLSDSQVTLADKILIDHPQSFRSLLKVFAEIDEK